MSHFSNSGSRGGSLYPPVHGQPEKTGSGGDGKSGSRGGSLYPPEHAHPEKRERWAARRRWIAIKILVWGLSLAPLSILVIDALTGNLAAEPVKDVIHRTGWWTLVFLVATLAITPIRYVTGWKNIVRLRRLIGLFAFFYATLHFLSYFALDQFFALEYIIEDIVERPYITVGFAAWLLLIPLAITSTKGWIRKLGKRWRKLHRLVYLITALGVLHFYWLVKADTLEPLIFLGIVTVLLILRIPMTKRWRRMRISQVRKV